MLFFLFSSFCSPTSFRLPSFFFPPYVLERRTKLISPRIVTPKEESNNTEKQAFLFFFGTRPGLKKNGKNQESLEEERNKKTHSASFSPPPALSLSLSPSLSLSVIFFSFSPNPVAHEAHVGVPEQGDKVRKGHLQRHGHEAEVDEVGGHPQDPVGAHGRREVGAEPLLDLGGRLALEEAQGGEEGADEDLFFFRFSFSIVLCFSTEGEGAEVRVREKEV